MNSTTENRLEKSIHNAFIEQIADFSESEFSPRLLVNNPKEGQKLISVIERELQNCTEFAFSVAFITMGGLEGLLQTLDELRNKGIKGRVLTTDYQNFTQPRALEKLMSFENIEVRFFQTNKNQGFHTKGYLFENKESFKFIIGSSNLTAKALTVNKEWNMLFLSTHKGAVAQSIAQEFDALWNHPSTTVMTPLLLAAYEERYKETVRRGRAVMEQTIEEVKRYVPNSMQQTFINSLNALVIKKAKRALLLSATGTGKTYAAAFAMRDLVEPPKRVLFLVHREQIARQARDSFSKIFTNQKTLGLLSGNFKELDKDFIFATMQTMSKDETMKLFDPRTFDVIIIDEVHRAGSASYNKIMQYFMPKLWLGMTASPSRTDGIDIFSLFDHNIAHEISLKQALETDLLCPFHYFGVTDLDLGERDDDPDFRDFNKLTSLTRVRHILSKAKYYGHGEGRLKGLIFCSRNEEAKKLADLMKQQGIRCEALTGADSQDKRTDAIKRLVTDDPSEKHLDYLLTVDIFNEGVDIPEVNQIIMLRATESPVIFVQQLGRGLRKAENKDFLVVLDFIGNYRNNYMIPVALSSDRTYNKDNMRRIIATGNSIIAGPSTIHFDEIARKRIYESIDRAKTNDTKLIRDAYENLKFKLGRIPSIKDFVENGSIDPIKIIDKFGSYYAFLSKYEKDYENKGSLNKEQELMLEWLGQKYAKGKRRDELCLIEDLVAKAQKDQNSLFTYDHWVNAVAAQKSFRTTPAKLRCNAKQLSGQFNGKKHEEQAFIRFDTDNQCHLDPNFLNWIKSNDVFKEAIEEVIQFGLNRYQSQYSESYKDTDFVLYEKYTYEDVQRLLGWSRNMNAQNIGGYFYDKETKTLPVFINYEKAEDAIAYEDRFISPTELIALSKHPRSKDSPDADHMFKRTEADKDNRIYLFVRKNKDDNEAKEFYFLGEMTAQGEPEEVTMPASNDKAFEVHYVLDVPVRHDIYEYITEG